MGSALAGNTKNWAGVQPFVWLASAGLLAFILLASATGPTRVWTIPQDGSPDLIRTDTLPATTQTTVGVAASRSNDFEFSFPPELLLVLLTGLFVVFALLAIRALGPPVSMWRPRHRRRQVPSIDSVLPNPLGAIVQVDVDAAQDSLIGGHSKDAIIRCWMQVLTDITTVGYEPVASETSAEYVERVIGQASLDPTPIAALASLYREARFSRHELTEDHRSQAAEAVSAVAASLNSPDDGWDFAAVSSSQAIENQ